MLIHVIDRSSPVYEKQVKCIGKSCMCNWACVAERRVGGRRVGGRRVGGVVCWFDGG